MAAFRDSTVVIIETGRTLVRAGLGLHDLLKTPALEISARVGLRTSDLPQTNGKSKEGNEDSHGGENRSSTLVGFTPKVNDYLVGSQLDEALATDQDITVSWPFADGDIHDWTQAEAIWKYVLFKGLHIRRAQNESPVLLSIATGLSRSTHERICQVFFERFNVAGFAVLERPIAELYAANSLSGIVVNVGHDRTDITPIYDGFIVQGAHTTLPLGVGDCQNYLANLLRSNQSVVSALSPPDAPLDREELHKTLLELVKQILDENLIKVPSDGETAVEDDGVTDIAAVLVAGKEKAVIESGMKKKATAKASAAEQARAREIEALDLINVVFRGHTLTLGKERHRFCEPLFDPSLLKGLFAFEHRNHVDTTWPLQDAVGHAVGQTEVDQRQYILGGLFVTGELTKHVKGVGIALQSRLAPYVLNNPDQHNDVQPRYVRVITVPDYFAEYREKGDGLAAFLGMSIVAKIIFNDSSSKNFVSKADYTNKGPRSIIEMTPSLL